MCAACRGLAVSVAVALIALTTGFSDCEALRERVTVLERMLAETQLVLDEARVGRQQQEGLVEGQAMDIRAEGFRIVAVDRVLETVVVDGGRTGGVKTGLRFRVVRGRQVIAEARVSEVRAHHAAVRIERMMSDEWPAPGDRVVPGVAARE